MKRYTVTLTFEFTSDKELSKNNIANLSEALWNHANEFTTDNMNIELDSIDESSIKEI